jgi:hypothetical protein
VKLWWKKPRAWFAVVLTVILVLVPVAVVFLIHEGREKSDQWSSVVFGATGAVVVVVGLLRWLWQLGDLAEAPVLEIAARSQPPEGTLVDTADRTSRTHVTVVTATPKISPGQPGREPDFGSAYAAAGGADRLGPAVGYVADEGPGWVQHFSGGPDGEAAVICALPGKPAIALSLSIWNELVVQGGTGAVGVGFPVADPAVQPFIGSETDAVDLAGGAWGRTGRGRLTRKQSGDWLWQPQVAYDNETSADRDWGTSHSDTMDLRLRVAARIPIDADDLRITTLGRERMLEALDHSSLTEVATRLAERYAVDNAAASWQETAEPTGYNDSRFATYHWTTTTTTIGAAVRAELRLILPDGYRNEIISLVDLRIGFPVPGQPTATPAQPAAIPTGLPVTVSELVAFLVQGWHVATAVVPRAAVADPRRLRLAGAPRIGLYIINERPDNGGGSQVRHTLDMVDLSLFGRSRRAQIRDLSIAVTAALGLTDDEVTKLVNEALMRLTEDFGFTPLAIPSA